MMAPWKIYAFLDDGPGLALLLEDLPTIPQIGDEIHVPVYRNDQNGQVVRDLYEVRIRRFWTDIRLVELDLEFRGQQDDDAGFANLRSVGWIDQDDAFKTAFLLQEPQ